MQNSFNEIVDQIIEQNPRYDREAYRFVKEALEFTIKQRKRTLAEASHHVNAAELLDGFRQFVLKEFGPMASTVLEYWGVRTSEDVGQIVFDLIGAGVFGKTDSDTLEDFRGGLDFQAAFVQPFEPVRISPKGKS
jgi:uncharacterized repeat protein (TIGR04138 family)